MDLASLKEQVTNLSLYDLKAGVRKVQNGKLQVYMNAHLPAPKADECAFSCHELHRNGSEGIWPWKKRVNPRLTYGIRSAKQPTMNRGGHLPR